MADVNANIGVGIDTSDALNQLKNLQRQISQFHSSVAKSSESAAIAQRDLQKNFLNSVNAIQGFSAELKTVRTTAESFTNSLEKNKFSIREYFRYAAGASGKFSNNFAAEFSTIEKVAVERVKTLQTQYIKMGRDAQGAMQAIAIRPTTLNMQDLGTQVAITAQKQVIFNQLLKQGSTNLLNFGKNTQWAGRQLMVGFTLPLATLGMTAGRVFMDMEKAAIKFKKVYGDLFTAPEESQQAMDSIVELGKVYTAYGVAVSDALSMAADAAAAGFAGADLQNQTNAALKLSVLGQLELNKALETTISLQNAFGIASADLASEIDFLNAVENQTVVSLDDITTAVPKVAPVIQSLGGDVRDLAFFMAAMKEGGINASEGANALKSGLASLINPTGRAREMLSGFGVNLKGIIDANQGDVSGIVVGFAKALDELDPLNRAQAIEQLFGKFQFARLSTLFANVAQDGTQASRVLDLAGSSLEELAALSDKELGVAAASAMNKFLSAVENIKLALAPIGETFLQIATPIIEFGTKMLEAFNNLPDGIKKSITAVITIIGGIGPIALMTFGLINNGIANMIKFFATVRLGYLRITGQAKGVGDETQYMTNEQLEAAAAAASLDQAHSNLTQRFTAEKVAVDALRASYEQAVAAGNRFALLNPGMMKPGAAAVSKAPRLAKGGILSGPGTATSDSILAMLSDGEAVIPADVVAQNPELIKALIAGGLKIPGFAQGGIAGRAQPNRNEFAHITDRVTITLGELSAALENGTGQVSNSLKALVKDFTDTFGPDFKAHIYSGLGFTQDRKLNVGMRDGGAVSAQSFLDDFDAKGLEKWEQTLNNNGLKINDVSDELMAYDQKLKDGVTAMIAQNKNATITSDQFGLLEREVRAGMASTSSLKKALDAAATSLHEFRINVNQSDVQGAGLDLYQVPSGADPSRMSAKKRFRMESGREGRTGGTREVRVSPMAVFNDGLASAADTNSESKRTIKIAQDTANGYINELERQAPAVAEAATAVGTQATKQTQSRRASTNGNVVFDAQASQYQEQAKMAQINTSRQAGLARATQMTIDKVSEFAGKASQASFAIGSVAGIATMFGGTIGQVASIIMQVTLLFSALAAATSRLVTAKAAEAAMSMVTNLRAGRTAGGVVGTAGGFMGGAKGMEGLKNALGNIGKIFTALVPRVAAFAGVIGGGLTAVATALGVSLGVLLGGFVALAAVIVGGVVAYKIARDNVTKLGETANLSAEKIKKLGDIFGVTPRTADFAGKFTGTTAGTGEEQNKVTMVLESENFETDFKTQIEAIKSASKEDAESVLQSLTTQLSASGFESSAVEAIVNAISIKAGRKDLDLKFSSISFSSPEGLAAIDTVANQTIAKVQTAFDARNIWDSLGLGDFTKQLTTASAQFTTAFESLQIGFREGEISAQDLITSMGSLNAAVMSLDPSAAKELVNTLAKDLGMGDQVKELEKFEDKLLLINATTAGIEIPPNVVRALSKASKAGASKKDLQTAIKLRTEINDLIADEAKKLEEAKNAEEQKAIMTAAVQDAQESIGDQITALENEATAYQILMEAGWDAASAMAAVSDSAIAQGLAMAATADERQGLINDLAILTQMRAAADARKSAVSGG